MREFILKRQSKTKCQSYIVSKAILEEHHLLLSSLQSCLFGSIKRKKKITENDSVLYAVQPLSCCLTLCNPMDCSTPFIYRSLLKLVHWVGDVPFYCLPSFPASGSFAMNWLFASGGQSVGASASASVLPMNIQGWFPLVFFIHYIKLWFCLHL